MEIKYFADPGTDGETAKKSFQIKVNLADKLEVVVDKNGKIFLDYPTDEGFLLLIVGCSEREQFLNLLERLSRMAQEEF